MTVNSSLPSTSCLRQAQAAGRLRQRDRFGSGYAAVAEPVEAAAARHAYCLFRRANRYSLCDSPARRAEDEVCLKAGVEIFQATVTGAKTFRATVF